MNEAMPQHAAHDIASGQHGAITRTQMRDVGVSQRQLNRWLREGTLQHHRRGVYRFRGAPRTWESAVAANVLAAGPSAAASRGTAARLLSLRRAATSSPIQVTVPGDRRTIRPGVIVHATRELPAGDVITVAGMRCTNAARTIIDLAAELSRFELIALVDDAICARLVGRGALHRRALALANGRARVDTIVKVTHPDADGEFWSWLERTLGRHVTESDLPQPVWNAPILDKAGLIGYTDLSFPPFPVHVELHGLAFHRLPGVRHHDETKRNRATLAGYTVLTFTWHDVVTAPARVIDDIRAALVAAGWPG